MYPVTLVFVKLAIVAFLLRIVISRVQRAILYTVAALTTIYGVALFLILLLQCRPVSRYWNPFMSGGVCANPLLIVNALYANSAICMVTDFTMAILPVFVVWDLKMNTRTKLAAGFILGLGAL